MKVKASYTIEASFIVPLLCFILCGIIVVTLELYKQVETFYIERQEKIEIQAKATEWIRIESMVEHWIQEEE